MYILDESTPNSLSLLAVYGTLKKGYGNHRLIEDCKFVKEYKLKNIQLYNLGFYPGAKIEETKIPAMAEVYEIPPERWESLDWLEGVPHHYRRYKNKNEIYIYILNRQISEERKIITNKWG